uniref:Uncharacterized protein n=1 Tax=Oryza glumipatula TaxID=40148 RepID=A0A0D9YRI3_9ORYZ
MHPQGLPPPICPEHANADVMFWLLRSISGISSTTNIDSGSDKYSCIVVRSTSVYHDSPLQLGPSNSGTLSLREFHERYWSPDFKIGRSFRGCHFNCRSHELLWTHGRSCIHLIGDHENARNLKHPSQAGGNWQATQPARNSPKMSQQQSEPNHKNLQAKNLESD